MPTKPTNIIQLAVDGKSHDIDLYDLDGIEWRDIKRATGMSNQRVLEAALVERDFEALAALVWVWRKREEPSLTFEDVLRSVNYRPVEDDSEDSPPDPPD